MIATDSFTMIVTLFKKLVNVLCSNSLSSDVEDDVANISSGEYVSFSYFVAK